MSRTDLRLVAERLPIEHNWRLKLWDGEKSCRYVGSIEDEETARRIAACYNAAHGLPLDMLEAVGQTVVGALVPHRILTAQFESAKELIQKIRTFCHRKRPSNVWFSDEIINIMREHNQPDEAIAVVLRADIGIDPSKKG